jgi:cytochrome c2
MSDHPDRRALLKGVGGGVVWDRTPIDRDLTHPQAFIKGNRIAFTGITDPSARDDLLADLERATRP